MNVKSILFAAALTVATAANATIFNVTWSGEQFNNTARATGQLDIDTALYPELGGVQNTIPFGAHFQLLGLTVSGAASGNGSFVQSDFQFAYFAAFSPLNYGAELIGQAMSNGFNFGSFGAGYGGPSGDFNLFQNVVGAPTGTYYFQLTTNGGSGDSLAVTSIRVASVPEPASWALMIAGFGMVGAVARRRRDTTTVIAA